MKNKWLFLTMLLLAATFLSSCSSEEVKEAPIRPVKAMTIGEDTFTSRWFPGKAKAYQEVNLAFKVSGTLSSFPIKLGDEVTTGQRLAQLDQRDYQVELANAKAQLNKGLAALTYARAEYQRVKNILQQDAGAVSQSMLESRRGKMLEAKAQYNSAKAAVARAKDNLSYTYLNAPFNGTIVEKFVENFENVKAHEQVVRLVDTSRVEFTVQLPESLINHVAKINKTFVVFDNHPDIEIPATIKEMSKEASQTTRTYGVTLIMDQPQEFKILAGMSGKARADRDSIAAVAREGGAGSVEVPVAAVFSDKANSSFVWVIDNNDHTLKRRQIEMGKVSDNGILVTGLKRGEIIATAGVNTLVDDQLVRIIK